jgi:hypothetical protein
MIKKLVVPVIALLAYGLGSSGTAQQTITSVPQWKVVHVLQLTDLKGNFNAPIFTPSISGQFRVSIYSQIVQAASDPYSFFQPTLAYTNTLGALQFLDGPSANANTPQDGDDSWILPIQVLAGTPVQLTLFFQPDETSLVYNLTVVVERFESGS